MNVLAIEPHSHGGTVILTERCLTSLSPSLNKTLVEQLPKFYPTLRIVRSSDELARELGSSETNGIDRKRDVWSLRVVVKGDGTRRDVECTLICGPTCGMGSRVVLEWRDSKWNEVGHYPILF